MKKICVLLLLAMPFALQFCSSTRNSSKSMAAKVPAKITYVNNIQPLVIAHCSPCHIPPQGFKKAYNTYDAVKADIDPITRRIQMNPGDKGFMPFKHSKLADSTIQVFVQWKTDGLLEK